jgi:hypothetical protein
MSSTLGLQLVPELNSSTPPCPEARGGQERPASRSLSFRGICVSPLAEREVYPIAKAQSRWMSPTSPCPRLRAAWKGPGDHGGLACRPRWLVVELVTWCPARRPLLTGGSSRSVQYEWLPAHRSSVIFLLMRATGLQCNLCSLHDFIL